MPERGIGPPPMAAIGRLASMTEPTEQQFPQCHGTLARNVGPAARGVPSCGSG